MGAGLALMGMIEAREGDGDNNRHRRVGGVSDAFDAACRNCQVSNLKDGNKDDI
jgi:hypothetical protein